METTLGPALHVLNVPFAGALLAGTGISIALIGRLFVPRKGSVVFVSVVTALLKMLSLGGVVLNPMIAIVVEGLIAELTLSSFSRPQRTGFVLAGGAATLWCFFHPFLTQGLLAGEGVTAVYRLTLEKGAAVLGLDVTTILLILIALVIGHFLIGAVGGLVSWNLGWTVQKRLGIRVHHAEVP